MEKCSIVEMGNQCKNPVQARGMCVKHYSRWSKHGDPLKVTNMSRRDSDGTLLKCQVVGCENPVEARMLCVKHWQRNKRGLPENFTNQNEKSYLERFYEKVNKGGGAPSNPWRWDASMGECWLWIGGIRNQRVKSGGLYGSFKMGGKQMIAPRVSYILSNGEIPDALTVDHLCRNTLCVNPKHLEAITIQENHQRRAEMITACPKGHQLSGENLYISPSGSRSCRTCRKDASKRSYARKAESERW